MMEHSTSHGSIDPKPTLQDIYEEVDRIGGQMNQVLSQLGDIRQTLKELSSSLTDLHATVNDRE